MAAPALPLPPAPPALQTLHSDLTAAVEAAARAVTEAALAAFGRKYKEVAARAGAGMEAAVGGQWSCVVGTDFGCYVKHAAEAGYVSFSQGDTVVTLFMAP